MSRLNNNVIIAIAVAVLLGIGICIFCALGSGSGADGDIDLILWYVEGDEFHDGFADAAEEFNSLRVSGKTNVTPRGFISFEAIEKALKKVDADDAPDMIACSINEAALLYEGRHTVSCSDETLDLPLDALNEDFVACANLNDEIIAVPYAANTQMMLVNTDKIPDADQITSLEKLCSMSKKYYKENGKGMFTVADYASFFRTAMAQLGESFDAVNPRYTESKNCKNIYNLLAETAYDRGLTVSDDPVSDVVSGKIPCAIVSSSDIMNSADIIKESVEIYPCPCMETGNQVYTLETEGICICASSDERQSASVRFIKWFTSKQINPEFIGESGYIPAAGDMSALKSDNETFGKLRTVISSHNSKSEHADFPPNADYAKNRAEFIGTMQSVMDSLS